MQNFIFLSSTTSLTLQILLAATLWIGLAVLVNAVLFRSSAATRHRLWIVSLFGLMVLPIFSAILPHWFPSRWTGTMEVSTKIVIPYEIDSSNIEEFREKAEEPNPIVYVNHPPRENAVLSVTTVKPPQVEPVFSFSVLPWSSLVGVFLVLWIVGVLGFLGHLAISIRVVRRKIAVLEPFCEFSNDPILEQIYRKMQLRRPIRILKNDSETVPFTFGAFRSVIVLPQEATMWSDSQKRTIFTHETAHIARRDPFWQIFTHVVCALYWFHPLVWFAAHRIRIERELACDDTVVLRGEKPSTYAEVLLELAVRLKSVSKSSFADNCTVAILKKNVLKNRIRSLLNPKVCRTPLGRVGTGVFLVAAICGVLFTATISPFAQQKNEKPEQESAKEETNADPASPEKQNDEKTPYEKAVEEMELIRQKREAIAIPADAKPITLRGRVLNQDGSPAPIAMVSIKTCGVYKNAKMPKETILPNGHKSVPESSFPSYQNRFKVTDKEGYFALEKEVLPGENVFLYAFSSERPATEISNSVAFIAREDREDITLQLQKAVPVQGQVAYGDGEPAIEQVVEGKRYIPFLIGADVFEPESFTWIFQTKTDENGFYTLNLPPGEFTIRYLPGGESGSRKESAFDKALTKKIIVPKYGESENEPRVDLKLPTPLRCRVVKEDGSGLGTFYPYFLARSEDSTLHVSLRSREISDKESTLTVVYPPQLDGRIYILSLDKLWGAVVDVPDEKRHEIQTITLKPSATAKMRVLDKTSNEPVPGIEVPIAFIMKSQDGKNSYGVSTNPPAKTDENGIVTFRIPPGTGDYTFGINHYQTKVEKTQWTVQPNENIDLGDIFLDSSK